MESNTPLDRRLSQASTDDNVLEQGEANQPLQGLCSTSVQLDRLAGPRSVGRLTPTATTQSGSFTLRHFPIIRLYLLVSFQFSSVQSLNHIQLFVTPRLQHSRLLCPSQTPRVYSNSCPWSWWCHPNISSSVIPFSRLQSFPASGSFPMGQFFASGSQSIGVSASASVLPMNIQDWFSWWLTCLISLQSKGLSWVFSNTTVQKPSILWCSAFFIVQLSHPYMTTWKTIALTRQTFVGEVMSLLFNTLSRLVITFLPRGKNLLISWWQSPSALILEPQKIKSLTVSIVSPSICHEVMGQDTMILVFWMLSLKPTFSLSSFTFIKRLFSSSLSSVRVVSSAYLRLLIFLLEILIPAWPAWHFTWCTLHIS